MVTPMFEYVQQLQITESIECLSFPIGEADNVEHGSPDHRCQGTLTTGTRG